MNDKKIAPKGTIILFLVFAAFLILALLVLPPTKKTIPEDLVAILRPHAIHIQPFTLTDQNGKLFTEKDLKGKWSFFFFGYTACTDVCPAALYALQQVRDTLDRDSELPADMQIVFVSVDPERDTPEILSKYMARYGKNFIGTSGFLSELSKLSRQFDAGYMKDATNSSTDYSINHTSSIYLVDPQMRIIASFASPHDPETITSQYRAIRELFQ